MRWLALCTLLVLATTARASYLTTWKNQILSIFFALEGPPYHIIRTYDGFEERRYPAAKWACSEETNNDDSVMEPMFYRLADYINGKNQRGEIMAMTAPVVTEFTIRSPTDKTYTMCFYIEEKHQEEPAEPTDTSIFIQNRPDMRIFTRRVGGYMKNEMDWMEEAGQLAAILQEEGFNVAINHVFWAGYDSQWKFFLRRNEVWFPVPN